MSVSHLLYYFDSKEAVLEELCRKINARFLTDITAPSDDSPEQRIMALVDQSLLAAAGHVRNIGSQRRWSHFR